MTKEEAIDFMNEIEELVGIPIEIIFVGAERDKTIVTGGILLIN